MAIYAVELWVSPNAKLFFNILQTTPVPKPFQKEAKVDMNRG